jgi:hypothetical protein
MTEATHDIQELGLSESQTEHLRAHGITTIEAFGRLKTGGVVVLLGGSGEEQAIEMYRQWFEQNICPAVPPLPDGWKPVTQRSEESNANH